MLLMARRLEIFSLTKSGRMKSFGERWSRGRDRAGPACGADGAGDEPISSPAEASLQASGVASLRAWTLRSATAPAVRVAVLPTGVRRLATSPRWASASHGGCAAHAWRCLLRALKREIGLSAHRCEQFIHETGFRFAGETRRDRADRDRAVDRSGDRGCLRRRRAWSKLSSVRSCRKRMRSFVAAAGKFALAVCEREIASSASALIIRSRNRSAPIGSRTPRRWRSFTVVRRWWWISARP